MALHNRVSNSELKKRLLEESMPRITFSFYKYTRIDDPGTFRNQFYLGLQELKVFGRIYIATEGVNAQASVPEDRFDDCREFIDSFSFLKGVRLNIAVEDNGRSFWVLKIKVRDKIVADGIADPSFDVTRTGQYLDAAHFNLLTDDPGTLVVDMRNHYEYEVGHFKGAVQIPTDTFREQLPLALTVLEAKKEKPIVLYCTGGIRCEKASAYLLHHGFKQVYHLEGGIIEYARQVNQGGLPNKFEGKNFVFDGRLGERITEEVISYCHQCGKPADAHTNCRNEGCHLLFIQCEACAQKYQGCCSETCMEVIARPKDQRKAQRSGLSKGQMIFHQSSHRLRPSLKDLHQDGNGK